MAGPALTVSEETVASTVLDLAGRRGPDKTICPSEAAREIGGSHPDGWGPLMPLVRRVAVRLMKEGRVVIRRKGRPVDPDDFRGVYRISVAPEADGAPDGEGAGNSASVRPDRR